MREKKVEEVAEQLKLTEKQQEVFAAITPGENFTTGALADRLGMDKSYLTKTLKTLAACGEISHEGRGEWSRPLAS